MSLKCPNKNSQEWKDLVNIQGSSYASYLWNEFEEIPAVYTKEKYNPVSPQHLSNTVIKDLEDKLLTSLEEDFNMSIEEYSSIKDELGIDAKSATDLLSKVVAYEKGESIIPEVAYIAYKLLGKDNNKLKSDLRYLVNKWDNYSDRFNYHKGVVFSEEGFIEDTKEWRTKVVDLVIQDFLSEKIYQHHTNPVDFKKSVDLKWTRDDFTLWNKIVKMFENFLNKIKGVDKQYKLNRIGLSIADDILSRNYQYYNYNLEKGQVQKSYEETIASDPKAKEIADFGRLELNLNLTGSLALRRSGSVYRTVEETVHDIDWTVPYERSTTNEQDIDIINRIKDLQSIGLDRVELKEKTLAEVEKLSWFKDFKSKYPTYQFKTGFYGNETTKFTTIGVIDGEYYTEDGYHEESYSYLKKNLITKKTRKVTKQRRVKHKKGDYIQDTGYMIDFFIDLEPNNNTKEDYFKDWKSIMAAKLEMSRNKDLTDWKAFVPFKVDKDNNFTYKGFRHISYKDSNDTNSLEDTENSENIDSTFQTEEAFNWVSTIMKNSDNDLVLELLDKINTNDYNAVDELISLAEELETTNDSFKTNKEAWIKLNPIKQEEILEEASKEFNIKRKTTKDLPLYNITNKNVEVTLSIINNLKVAKQLEFDSKSVETIKQLTGWSNINGNWSYDANHIGINKSKLSYYKNSGTENLINIKDLLDDTLLKIYPQLSKVQVSFNNEIISSDYNNDSKVITLNPNNYVNSLADLLTLEVRKAIQSIEGDAPLNIEYNKENNNEVNNILELVKGINESQKEIILQSLDLSEYTGDIAIIDKVLNSFSLNETINSWLQGVKDFFKTLYNNAKDLLKITSQLINKAIPKSNTSDIKEPTVNNLIDSLSKRFGIKTRIISNEEISNFVDLKDDLLYSKLTKENIGNSYEDFLKSNFSFKEEQEYLFTANASNNLASKVNEVIYDFQEAGFEVNTSADLTILEKYNDYGYFESLPYVAYDAPYTNLQTINTNEVNVNKVKNDIVDISIEIENVQKEINRLEVLFESPKNNNDSLEKALSIANLILTKNKLVGLKMSAVGTLWLHINRKQETKYSNHNLRLVVDSSTLYNAFPNYTFNLVDTTTGNVIGILDTIYQDQKVTVNRSKIADAFTNNIESYGKSLYRAISWGAKSTFNEHLASYKSFDPVDVNGKTKEHAKDAWNRWLKEGIAIDKGEMFQFLYSKYGDNINGFYDSKNKEAYLVDTKADVSTTIHEAFSHPFIQVIKDSNQELYQSLLNEASNIKEIREAINDNYSELDQDTKEQEIIAHAIDMYVNNELDAVKDKTLIARIKEFFKQLSKSLKSILNIKNLEAKDIPLLTLQEVAQYALYGKGTMDLTKATSSDSKTLLQLNISNDKLNASKKKALEAKLAAFKAKKEAKEQEVLNNTTNNEINTTVNKVTPPILIPNTELKEKLKGLSYSDKINKLVELGVLASFDRTLTKTNNVNDIKLGWTQNRPVVFVNLGNEVVPFYRSSKGTDGKEQSRWYPFFGFGEEGWLVKGSTEQITSNYNNPIFEKISNLLTEEINYDDKLDKQIGKLEEFHPLFKGTNQIGIKDTLINYIVTGSENYIDATPTKNSLTVINNSLNKWFESWTNYVSNLKSNNTVVNPIDITSKSNSQLGKDLTNVHYARNGKSQFDIIPTDKTLKNPSEGQGMQDKTAKETWGNSVEAWYKTNNAKANGIAEGPQADAFDFKLMVSLIQDKLTQYPNLITSINSQGGLEFINQSTHNMGTGRWSSKGKNMFIKALAEAYTKVNGVITTNINKPFYTGDIVPSQDTVFVFGSNPIGVNGNPTLGTGGAALVASTQFGVKQGEKMDNKLSNSGNAYGLTTVTGPGNKLSVTPRQITANVTKMYEVARQNPNKIFKVAFRNTDSTSLNGYTGNQMIDMFVKAGTVPNNVQFSEEWIDTKKLDKVIPSLKPENIESNAKRERSTAKHNVNSIYSKLGKTTKTILVETKPVFQREGIEYAKSKNAIFSLRVDGTNTHFGNPYVSISSDVVTNYLKNNNIEDTRDNRLKSIRDMGLIPTVTTRDSVEKYMNWILNGATLSTKNMFKTSTNDTYLNSLLSISNRFIGHSDINGSSILVTEAENKSLSNVGEYSSNDIVTVEVTENSLEYEELKSIQDKTIKEAVKALNQGAVVVTKAFSNSTRLSSNLNALGFESKEETLNGRTIEVWYNKANNPYRAGWIRQQLRSQELKGKKIIYYKELNQPSHATGLAWMINSKDSPFNIQTNKTETPIIEKVQPKSKSILLGGFSDEIKSEELGNDADIAMREAATGGSIVEMSYENVSKANTTLTTLMDNDTLENTNPLKIIIKDIEGKTYDIYQRDNINDKNYPVSVKRHNGSNYSMFGTKQGEVIALSRDEGLRGKPLMDETKKSILEAHNNGVTFVVRDRSSIDSYFISYLDAIGASYSLYHTGKSPNIQPSKVVTGFDENDTEGFKFKDNKIKDIKQINIADENTSLLGLKTRLDNLGEKLKINDFTIKRIYNELKANFSRRFKLDVMSDSVSKLEFVRSEEYLLQSLEDLNSLSDDVVPSNYKQLANQLITSQINKINSDSILNDNSNIIDFSKSKNTLTKNEESIIGLMYKFKVLKYNYDVNKTLDINYDGNEQLEKEIKSIYTIQLEEHQIDKYKKALSPKIGLPNLIAKTKGDYKVEIEKARLIAGDNDSQGEKVNKWIESLIQSAVDNAKYLALGALNLTLDNADIQSAITFLGLSKEGIISLLTNKEFSEFFNGYAKNNDIMNMDNKTFSKYLDEYAETNNLVDLAPDVESNQSQVEFSISYLNSIHRSKDLRLSSFNKNYVYHMMTVLVKYSDDYGNINNELKSQYPIKGRPSQQEGQFEQILKGLGLEGYSPSDVEKLLNELDEHLETGNSIFSSDYFVNRMQTDSILPKGMVALAFPHSREMLRSHIQFHKIKQASHLLHTPKIKKFRETLANMMDSKVFNKGNGKDKVWNALYNAIGNIFLFESYFSGTTKGNDVLRNVLNKSDGMFNPINITALTTGQGLQTDTSIEYALYKAKDSEEFLSHAANVVKTIKSLNINKDDFAFIHSLDVEGNTIKFRASETMLDMPQQVAKFKAQYNKLPKELRDMLFKYLLIHKSYGLTYSTDSWFGFMDYNIFKNYNKFLNIAELAPGTLFKNDYLYRELIYFSLQNTEYLSQFRPYTDNSILNGENYYKVLNTLPDTIPSFNSKDEPIKFKKPIMTKAKRGFKSNIGQSISKKDFVNKSDADNYNNNITVSYNDILIASIEKDSSLSEKLRLAKAELVKTYNKEKLDELGVSSKKGEKYKWITDHLRRDNLNTSNFTDKQKLDHFGLISEVDFVLNNDLNKLLKDKETSASFVYVNELSKIKEEISAEVERTNKILDKAGDIVINVDTTIETDEGPVIIKENKPYNELTSKFASTKSLIAEQKQELQLILDNLLDDKKSELIYENEINKRFIKGISNVQENVLDYIPESIELPKGQPLLKTLIKRESENGEQEQPIIAVYMATPKVLPHITEAEGYVPKEGDNDLVYRRIYNYNENSLINPHFVTMDMFDKRLKGILYNNKNKTEFLGENWETTKNKEQESFEEWVQYGASMIEDNMYYDQQQQEQEETVETKCN